MDNKAKSVDVISTLTGKPHCRVCMKKMTVPLFSRAKVCWPCAAEIPYEDYKRWCLEGGGMPLNTEQLLECAAQFKCASDM